MVVCIIIKYDYHCGYSGLMATYNCLTVTIIVTLHVTQRKSSKKYSYGISLLFLIVNTY